MSDLVEVTLVWTLGNGQRATSAFRVNYIVGVDGGNLVDIAQAAYAGWDSDLKADFPATDVLLKAEAQKVGFSSQRLVPLSPSYESSGGPLPGTHGGSALPNYCAAIYSYRASTPGRRYRNRMYLPPLSEGDVGADGDIAATLKGNILADLNTLITSVKNTLEPTVSGGFKGVNLKDGLSWDVVAARVDGHVGTMRSRMVPAAS